MPQRGQLRNRSIDPAILTPELRAQSGISLSPEELRTRNRRLLQLAYPNEVRTVKSRERARQIEHQALRDLKRPALSNRLRNFTETEPPSVLNPRYTLHFESTLSSDLDSLPSARQPGEWQPPRTTPKTQPLTEQEQRELWEWVDQELSIAQKAVLPLMLQGIPDTEIARRTRRPLPTVIHARELLLRDLRLWFTTDLMDQYGSPDQIRDWLIHLASESRLERLFRQAGVTDLLAISQGDVEGIKELILELYPREFTERELDALLEGHFKEIASRPAPRQPQQVSPRQVLTALGRAVSAVGEERARRRQLVWRRFFRDFYYPLMRRDEETDSAEGLQALEDAIGRAQPGSLWRTLLEETYTYYAQARAYRPRGFRAVIDGNYEPLIPAQRYGIWQALQSLQNPEQRSALLTSEARVGKTIMAILAAFNIRTPQEEYAVRKVLYTTTNQAKYEVADEVRRCTNTTLNCLVMVVDGDLQSQRDIVREAIGIRNRNVVLIAHYQAIVNLTREFERFRPDVHIIDEINNLRRGDQTIRAPIIFGVPALYRIGVSARPVVVRAEDIALILAWARPRTYPNVDEIRRMSGEVLYAALEPISVRWRRKVVLPELTEPEYQTVYVPYSELQDQEIHWMREDFVQWKRTSARADKVTDADHLFARFELERQASIDLSLVKDGVTEVSPKIQQLDAIIDQERRNHGKVLVLVDFVEPVNALVDRYNQRFGAGSAVAITSEHRLRERNALIWNFRSEGEPSVLIGTSFLLGSSLNLFQLPGRSFHTSTVVRLSRPWWNVDDGERLVGIGQTYPVKVITLVSQFRTQPWVARGGLPEPTVEELQERNLAGKRELFDVIVDAKPALDDELRAELESMAESVLTETSQSAPAGQDKESGSVQEGTATAP